LQECLQDSYYFASSLLHDSSDLVAVSPEEQESNSTSTDLFASSLWKNGPFAVTHQEQVYNGTDLFALSLLQTASASLRLRENYDIASSLWLDTKPMTTVLQPIRAVCHYTMTALAIGGIVAYVVPHAIFHYAMTALMPKSSAPARSLSPDILHVLSKECPIIATTCEVDVVDTKPMTTVLQPIIVVSRYTILRFTMTAFVPKSSAPARSLSPEIMRILSKQCARIATTCEVDAVDTKPVTALQPFRVVYRYAIVVGTIVVAFIAMKVTEAIWYYYWLVWIQACAATMQFLIVNPCSIAADFVKNAFKIILSTAFLALRTAATFALRIGDVREDADDVLHIGDVREDADDDYAGQDDAPVEAPVEAADAPVEAADAPVEAADAPVEAADAPVEAADAPVEAADAPVEAPVAPVTIAAPPRRSKRIAARQCRALFLEVAPNTCVARGGPRRSARLAVRLRVSYKSNKQ
jgi:hypothetical protein